MPGSIQKVLGALRLLLAIGACTGPTSTGVATPKESILPRPFYPNKPAFGIPSETCNCTIFHSPSS